MNPLNINHIKVEKTNSIKLKYQNLRKISNFFRVFEIFLIFAVISRISFQLPLAIFKFSNECIHNLFFFLVSPPFVFILGNAIVITLFVNSGQCYNTKPNTNKSKSRPSPRKISRTNQKYVSKQDVSEENAMMAMIFSTQEHNVIRIYHRSQSEKIQSGESERKFRSLRRSNTQIMRLRDSGCCNEAGERHHYPEDHMSSDEFRRTIEEFIAKQQKFLREEECLALEE